MTTRLRTLHTKLFPALLVVTLCACGDGREASAVASLLDHSTQALSGSVGQVSVVVPTAVGREAGPASISAQFVEYYGVDEHTVRGSLDWWRPAAHLNTDECEVHETQIPVIEDWYGSRIDLLHAGVLEVAIGDEVVALEPRPLRSALPYFGGFIYGTDPDDRPVYEAARELTLWSDGGYDLPSFEHSLTLPAPIYFDRVGGVWVGSADALAIDTDRGLAVGWSPNGETEPVYLTVSAQDPHHPVEVVCRVADDGRAFLDADLFDELGAWTGGLDLTIRRAQVDRLDVPEFDRVELVVVTQHSIELY